MKKLETTLASWLSKDLGLLILRISTSLLMLFHGAAKLMHGVGGLSKGLAAKGLPEFLAYGVYVGEVIAPVLIIVGLYTRISSIIVAGTMVVAIYVAHGHELFTLGKFGAPVIELPFLYLIVAITLLFTGPGKYSINK